jgi:hypothetical protein
MKDSRMTLDCTQLDSVIIRYSGRTSSNDSIFYISKRIIKRVIVNTDTTTTITTNTLTFIAAPDDRIIDKLPWGNIFLSGISDVTHNNMSVDSLRHKYAPSIHAHYYSYNDTCWAMILADGCDAQEEYIEGLGGLYYSCFYNGGYVSRELLYSKITTSIWIRFKVINSKQ